MKKLLLGTAAVAFGMTFAVAEANAQVKLNVGGYTKMYGVWLDQDETGDDPDTAVNEAIDVRGFDMARDTEIHFTGETTLDNGLTVGFHTEAQADVSGPANAVNDSFDVQESYAYFSGAWGRVNVGAEDGATYLLQVAAPSADSNVDGIRQWINPINHGSLTNPGTYSAGATAADNVTLSDLFANGFQAANLLVLDGGAAGVTAGDVRMGPAAAFAAGGAATFIPGLIGGQLDYDHAVSGWENKLTYMTPVFNGFQAGVSYTPELGSGIGASGLAGNNVDDTIGDYGNVWELAARYEGQFDQLGFAIGGGWSHAELEQNVAPTAGGAHVIFYQDVTGNGFTADDVVTATLDDREAWNVGLALNWGAFGLGAVYTEDDNGVSGDNLESETWVVGLDYTTGPFKIGASYLNQDQAFGPAEIERERWTGGVVYTYGPGMTFRGSISHTEFDENIGTRTATSSASGSAEATSILLGTQINF